MFKFTVFIVCAISSTSIASGNTDPCKSGASKCDKMRESCFVNADAADGYLCCVYDKERNTYIFQEKPSSPIINCDPLSCIVCDSDSNPKCGENFDYEPHEVKKLGLEVDCIAAGTTNPRACRKMVITRKNDVFVRRSCYNTTKPAMQWYPNKCFDLQGVTSCYCNSKLCNGEGRIVGAVFLILICFLFTLWH